MLYDPNNPVTPLTDKDKQEYRGIIKFLLEENENLRKALKEIVDYSNRETWEYETARKALSKI